MNLQLPSSISSRQDLKALILELRGLSRWFSQTATKQKVSKSAPAEQPAMSPAAQELISQQAGKQINQADLDKLIKALEDYAGSAPYASVTLAAPAPNALRKELVEWFRKNVKPDILVDFKFNSTMLGGMVISYDSHVHDWSFKRQILAARAKFPETLRHV